MLPCFEQTYLKEVSMSYTMQRLALSQAEGIVTNAVPLTAIYSCEAHEVQSHRIAIVTSAVSGGINSGNPVAITMSHSFDEGSSWLSLVSLEVSSALFAAGTVTIGPGPMTVIIGPLIKLTIVPPSNETVTVSSVSRTHCVGHHPFIPRAPVAVTSTDNPVGFGFTAIGDAIVPAYGATSDAYVLKSGGIAGTVVQTITINYTDATKAVALNYVRT